MKVVWFGSQRGDEEGQGLGGGWVRWEMGRASSGLGWREGGWVVGTGVERGFCWGDALVH